MTTNYLRFADQATWESAAATAGFRVNNPTEVTPESFDADTGELVPAAFEDRWTWLYYTHDWAIDVVGTIYNDDATFDPETREVVTPATAKTGYHVNFVGSLPTGWDEFLVNPVAPYRVFA
jgi:hypothetical protein